jgi:hypothetical protein
MTPVDPDELLRENLGDDRPPSPKGPVFLVLYSDDEIAGLEQVLHDHGWQMSLVTIHGHKSIPPLYELTHNAAPDQVRL